ncbi:MAG: LLM class flavin-dependent oxidoreductase, partial [Pseudonocardia sp.]|nr:LLM class flavin-dependent oxidoreductase [Pseudonocardia sp.]
MVAERLAFLDHLTHGRLEYGFGGGGLPTDKALFGLEPTEAAPRTTEALEIIWQLLTSDDPVTYEGVYWKYENRQLQVGPYQDVPPFAIAGLTGLHNYAKCGANGWKPLSVHFAPIDSGSYTLAPDLVGMGTAMLEAGATAGIDPAVTRENWRIVREVYVTDDKNQAMRDIREGVKRSYDYLFGLGLGALMKKGEGMEDPDLTFEWMVDNIPWIIGSPDDCIRQVKELEEATGGFGTLLINCRDWVTTDKWNRSLELFARYVTPQFTARERMARRQHMANVALGTA